MKRSQRLICHLFIVFTVFSATVEAATLLDSLVKSGAGARALGMGSAHVAIANDSTASLWNPAGLAFIDERQMGFMRTDRFGIGLKYDYVSGILPLKKNDGLALSFMQEAYRDIPVTDETGAVISYTENFERVFNFSYGRQVNYRFGIGGNIKWLWHKLYTGQASGWEADLGLLYRLSERWRFGLKLADFSPLEIKWNTGASDKVPWEIVGGFSFHSRCSTFVASLELGKTPVEKLDIRTGIEYRANNVMTFRGGWNKGFTGGFSLSYRNWDFDYAWINDELGDYNVLTATVYLDKLRSSIRRDVQRKEDDLVRRQARVEMQRLPERKHDYTDSTGKPVDVLAVYKERQDTKQWLEMEGSLKDLKEASRPENQAAETHYRLGNTFLMDGLYNQALEEYRAAIAADPTHVMAHFNLGAVYAKIQMNDKAIYQYTIVTELDPRNLNAHLNLGDLHLARGDKVEAARHFNKIILMAPDSLNADVARDRLEKL